MPPAQDTDELRQKLWEITVGPNRESLSNLEQRFAELASEFSHTIKVLPNPYESSVPLERNTCFLHVFGLAQCARYIEIAQRNRVVFAGAEFVRFLLDRGILREIKERAPTDGDIILYCDGDQPKHAGFLREGKVCSKWGTGHFMEHAKFEVPISYGHELCYFELPSKEEVVEAFVSFARSKGVSC